VQCVGAISYRPRRSFSGDVHPTPVIQLLDIIGGHREAGETFERTLVREVKEEIGVTPVDLRS